MDVLSTSLTGFIVVVLGAAALLTLIRIVRGPSVLDRAIAAEVILTILVCALGAEAALTRHTTTLPILVSLSLLGFIGSVAVVRFVPTDVDPQEDAALDASLPGPRAGAGPDGGPQPAPDAPGAAAGNAR